MAINIDDTIKRKAIKILEDEQTQLNGAYDKQAVKGSRGMESEFIPETSKLTKRKEKRISKDSKGRYSEREVTVDEKYYDESVVDEKEKQFEDDAKTLQEVAKAFDEEMNRLNGLINDIKVEIVDLSSIASQINCWPGMAVSTGVSTYITKSFRQETAVNKDVERTKIYPKMAGPGYDPGTENPFDPDTVVSVESTYAGYGYENIRDNNEYFIKTASGITSTGKEADGSGSSIGTGQFELGDLPWQHSDGIIVTGPSGFSYPGAGIDSHLGLSLGGSYDSNDSYYDPSILDAGDKCASIAQQIKSKYEQIITIRKERDSYRKKLNQIKKSKSEKELSHWGYQNTKNEVNVRKNKNSGAILAINQLDSEDAGVEEGLVLHFDASNNSSYFGSGTTWYDISRDDYDDNGSIVGATYVENTLYPERSYFNFDGTADHVSFDINNSLFGNPTTVTVEMLAQLTIDETTSDEKGYLLFSWGKEKKYAIWTGEKVANLPPALGYTTANGDLYGLTKQQVDSLQLNRDGASEPEDVLPGQWKHYIFEMRSDVSYTNNKIYINGVERSLQQLTDVGDPLNSWNPILDSLSLDNNLTPNMWQILHDPYKFTKIIDNNLWNGRVHSNQGYTTAFMSWSTQTTSGYAMAGLTADPYASTSYDTIDYAWFYLDGGSLGIYENGSNIGTYGTYTTSTVTSIIYDGEKVRYYKDGVLQREIDPTHGSNPLHFSSSTYSTGKTWSANFWEYTNDTTRTERVENRNFDNGSGTISNYSYEMPMELSLFRVYNRALTQEEININFEEVRSRFNL